MKYTKAQDTPNHKGEEPQNNIRLWFLRVATVLLLAFLAYAGGTVVDRVSVTAQIVSCEYDRCLGGPKIGICLDGSSSATSCNKTGWGCETNYCSGGPVIR